MSGNGPTLLAAPDPATVKWVPLGGGQSGSMIALDEIVVPAGGQASIDFQNIPQGYSALRIEGLLRHSIAAFSVIADMTFNGDTGANYDSALALLSTGAPTGEGGAGGTACNVGRIIGASAVANRFSPLIVDIPGYAKTDTWKGVTSQASAVDAGNVLASVGGAHWRSLSAVTRVTLTPRTGGAWVAGSRATLYGLTGPGASLSLGGGSADLVYNGEYPAATPYTDGDIVIYQGQAYLCVRPTSAAPVPWAPTYAGFPSVRLRRAVAQTIANNAFTPVLWDTEDADAWGLHDLAANTNRVTIPTGQGGDWQFSANVIWAPNATGPRSFYAQRNAVDGSANILALSAHPAQVTYFTSSEVTFQAALAAGDWVSFQAYQVSGGNLDLQAGMCWLSARRVA